VSRSDHHVKRTFEASQIDEAGSPTPLGVGGSHAWNNTVAKRARAPKKPIIVSTVSLFIIICRYILALYLGGYEYISF
jgi:hypothetical protein